MVFSNKFAKTQTNIDNKDITARFSNENQMSMEAYMSLGSTSLMRGRILKHIKACGSYGATCDEIENDLGFSHQGASARCTQLKALENVRVSGEKRKTRSGRNADVLIYVKGIL